jgi:hypothetical protein
MAEGAVTHTGPANRGGSPSRRVLAFCVRYRVAFYLLFGLVALDFAVGAHSRVWRAYDPDEYRERLAGCLRRPHDLVVVGGSTVAEGVDPAALRGLSWQGQAVERPYNVGLLGATTSEVWHCVEHGLIAPPRLLIYGITASDLNDSRDEPEGPRHLMTGADVASWASRRPGALEWCARQYAWERLGRLWKLCYYRNGIRLWAADRAGCLWPGAFAEAAAEAHRGLERSAALHRDEGYAPDPAAQVRSLAELKAGGSFGPPAAFLFLNHYRLGEHLGHLHRLLDWAAERGTAVVLLDMPVSADLEERLHPREFATYRAALAEVERGRGVPVLRASRATVGLDDEDFADLIHLNARGSARLGTWLRPVLESNSPRSCATRPSGAD